MKNSYSAAFKKKVALEAIEEEKTLAQIAIVYNVHPVQVSKWKQELLEGAEEIFRDKRRKNSKDQEGKATVEACEKKIGQLTLMVDFLKKKLEL
jgi:transposase